MCYSILYSFHRATVSVKTFLTIFEHFSFKIDRERKLLVPPPFNVLHLKEYVMNSLTDAIEKSSRHLRDPVGGTYSNWLV